MVLFVHRGPWFTMVRWAADPGVRWMIEETTSSVFSAHACAAAADAPVVVWDLF